VKLELDDLKEYLLNEHLSEAEHVKNIVEMSLKFTRNRESIKDYVLDENKVSSYAYFYLPTNAPKLSFLLNQLHSNLRNEILNSPFIDVGCGPGTFSYAFSEIANEGMNIFCVDSSSLMLDQARKILTNKFPNNLFSFSKKLDGENSNATLFFGNSINEMGIQKALDIINIVNPKIVIFIEPGTSELFLELKKLRKELLSFYDVHYPCPSNSDCPNEWCHQILRTGHSLSVERLSQLVNLDRKIMAMCAHVYVRKNICLLNEKKILNEVTIIRYLNETKFSYCYEVCLFEDDQNKLVKIEILKKKMSKFQEKHFKNLSVGERIIFEYEKTIGDFRRGNVL
jgi:SAM-dependent methyltransferase